MKEKIMKIADALSGVSVSTWVVLATILLAVTNAILTATGHNPIEVSDDQLFKFVSWTLVFASIGYGIWKNMSITKSAQTADEVLKLLKQGLVTVAEVQQYVQQVKEKQNTSADQNTKTVQNTGNYKTE
ncbi:phage holin [Acetobacterium wieringae]|uniref:Phage lysis protein, holin n=1 Tax=Acetobacterium wieringae TaxID=52694 RepID=A0A1F2PEE7_9FIRM|nr:phage holin [Acetobacterium wieringae]OFV69242.1 phage lysis protein, holin [Acetobacterium wieringae]